jgi:DNA-binding NtrC family response regulator
MVEITLPRLNQRREDLPLLTRHFLERFNREYGKSVRGLTRRAQLVVANYPWPGNVRELENVLGHACMMADQEFLDVRDLPEHLHSIEAPVDEEVAISLAEMERRHARRVVEHTRGNKTQAAAILGIGRTTLYRILGESEQSDTGEM